MTSLIPFQQWLVDNLDPETLLDLPKHGAQNGIPGLIYYSELNAVYNEYRDDIWDAVGRYAEDIGEGVGSVLARLYDDPRPTHNGFITAIVWFAAEYWAQEWIDHQEVH